MLLLFLPSFRFLPENCPDPLRAVTMTVSTCGVVADHRGRGGPHRPVCLRFFTAIGNNMLNKLELMFPPYHVHYWWVVQLTILMPISIRSWTMQVSPTHHCCRAHWWSNNNWCFCRRSLCTTVAAHPYLPVFAVSVRYLLKYLLHHSLWYSLAVWKRESSSGLLASDTNALLSKRGICAQTH